MKAARLAVAALGFVAGIAHATISIPSPLPAGSVTFQEDISPSYGWIDYVIENNLSDTAIVAFAISTGDTIHSGDVATHTPGGWSGQHIKRGEWAAAEFGSAFGAAGNPFAAYAAANPVFSSVFNGLDKGVAMYWTTDASLGIAPNDYNPSFSVFNVWAASDILAFTADGRTYRSSAFTAPIPEPSTYALMAACLGVVTVAARRRA
jgi:hypothetical protein